MINLFKNKIQQAPRVFISGALVIIFGFVIGFLTVPTLVSMVWEKLVSKSIATSIEDGEITTGIVLSDSQFAALVNSVNGVLKTNGIAPVINNNISSASQNNSATNINSKTASLPTAKQPQVRRLYVPTANTDLDIVEGANEKALFKGAWRSPYSSTPDKGGNTVLFGHRYLHLPPRKDTLFSLDKVKVGDPFEISWDGRTYKYKVVEVKVVNPDDISVLNPTAKPSVTIITCTPVFTTKFRLVVRGELVSE